MTINRNKTINKFREHPQNFENLEKGLQEIYRVLKTNGIIVILEPSMPNIFLIKSNVTVSQNM